MVAIFCIVVGSWVVPEPPVPMPECSDGIDNDGDGYTDDGNGNDPECQFLEHFAPPTPPTVHDCPLWMSEANGPTNLQQCNDGF